MAVAGLCASQLSHLPSPQRHRATKQLNNKPNWSCDMSAHNEALNLVNNQTPNEIFKETFAESRELELKKALKTQKCKKAVTDK